MSNTVHVLASRDPAQQHRPLQQPPTTKYTAVNDILDGTVATGQQVNVVGVVTDVLLPKKSNGSDFKMTLKLADRASQASGSAVTLHIFHPHEDHMPHVVGPLDVVYVYHAKVQTYYGRPHSLISNPATTMVVFPRAVLQALHSGGGKGGEQQQQQQHMATWRHKSGLDTNVPVPDNAVAAEAAALLHDVSTQMAAEAIGTAAVGAAAAAAGPGDVEALAEAIQAQVARSARPGRARDKRAALQDVQNLKFYDLLVHVVAEPYFVDDGSRATLWVSDYTTNSAFLKKGATGLFAGFDGEAAGDPEEATVGDEYGYLTKFGRKRGNEATNWTGPVGRRSMLVTCFDEHAQLIREAGVRRGSWVKLANVQVRYGHNGLALEGVFRVDRDAFRSRVPVAVLDMDDLDHETMDPWLRAALEQQDKYEKTVRAFCKEQKKKQRRRQKQQQQQQNKKRKDGPGTSEGPGNGQPEKNRRQRREAERARREASLAASDAAANSAVVAEAGTQPVTPLQCVLQLHRDLCASAPLPFINTKFRAKVRVVDYLPRRLEDFATGRWVGALERAGAPLDLSEEEEEEEEDEEEEEEGEGFDGRGTVSSRVLTWEWRFALLLEDASDAAETAATATTTATPKTRVWAVVANADAEMLTGLEACDLRKNKSVLNQLRQKMWLLWGNLNETKVLTARRAAAAARKQDEAAKAAAEKEAAEKAAAEKAAEKAAAEKEAAEKVAAKQKAAAERAKRVAAASARSLKAYPMPAASSDVEESSDDVAPSQRSRLSQQTQAEAEAGPGPEVGPEKTKQPEQPEQPEKPEQPEQPEQFTLSNLPFYCCIKQFGILAKVEDTDSKNSDGAGDGHTGSDADSDADSNSDAEPPVKREWRQMFSMFGTTIKG